MDHLALRRRKCRLLHLRWKLECRYWLGSRDGLVPVYISEKDTTTMDQTTFGLTQVQRDVLLVIQELSIGWVSPSFAEIAHELEFRSKSHIRSVLHALRDRGWIDLLPRRSRSIRVLRRIDVPPDDVFVGFFEDVELVREFGAYAPI